MAQATEPPLSYERPAKHFATRRQFRVLLVLVLLNLAITIQTAYAPGLIGQAKQLWEQYQQTRRDRALRRQAMSFTQPAGTVVWDEDPRSAAALLATPAYKKIRVEDLAGNYEAVWPAGARLAVPDLAKQSYERYFGLDFGDRSDQVLVQPDASALVLMHGLKTPTGEDRFVVVCVKGMLKLSGSAGNEMFSPPPLPVHADKPVSGTAVKELSLVAVQARVNSDGTTSSLEDEGAELSIFPANDRGKAPWTWTPSADGKTDQIQLEPIRQFRFYAGQLDPADPAHFTVPCDVDGTRQIIHGRLQPNGSLVLQPESGQMLGNRWYPGGP